RYHDVEWGKPLHDDRMLFEFLALDGMQAGLSWNTILRKRENFRQAFDHFEIEKVAAYDEAKIQQLLENPGIVRNKAKINAIIHNANRVIAVREEFGSLDHYLWGFVGGKTVQNCWQSLSQIPATSAISDAMSKDMVGRGFKFCGSTILYAFMQAAGMINDHIVSCFRYKELKNDH
ncbi:DNA-3-methyladenine glycosylase I, partial [bacterium]|nr:DNA-3-methyladenine glycosylase I [bacterium]